MFGRAVKGIGKVAAKGTLGGIVAGPPGAALAMAAKPMRKGAMGAARSRGSLRGATMGMHAKAVQRSGFLKSHVGLANATGFMARHPVMTATAAYGTVSGYNKLPGSHVSRRNQNDPYLRRIRNHQQSSSLSRMIGSSTGAFA